MPSPEYPRYGSFNDTGPSTDPNRVRRAEDRARWDNFSFQCYEKPKFEVSSDLKQRLARMRD